MALTSPNNGKIVSLAMSFRLDMNSPPPPVVTKVWLSQLHHYTMCSIHCDSLSMKGVLSSLGRSSLPHKTSSLLPLGGCPAPSDTRHHTSGLSGLWVEPQPWHGTYAFSIVIQATYEGLFKLPSLLDDHRKKFGMCGYRRCPYSRTELRHPGGARLPFPRIGSSLRTESQVSLGAVMSKLEVPR